MKIGQMVFAKKGRDKGMLFIVMCIQNEYLFLVDGKHRTLANPKKKKVMHVQPTNYIAEVETDGRALQDSDIRKHINEFLSLGKGGRSHWQKTM